MGTFAFQHGTKIYFDNKCYILLRKVTDEIWQLEDCSTKRILEYTDDQLRSFYANGQLTFVNSKAINYKPNDNQNYLDIPPAQWEQAKIRRAYVMATLNTPNTRSKLKPIIYKIWSELGKPDVVPNPATVIRWKNKFIKAGNDIVSLIERHDTKGNKAPRYPQEVTEFVQQAINTVYLTLERNTIEDTHNRAYVLTGNENELRPAELKLPLPTKRLVKNVIEAIPAFDRYVARHGHTEAIRVFRSVLAHRTTLAPLERAEIDHTPLDLIVIDDETNLPLGRPWVTACIDDYTCCVLGIHISFEPHRAILLLPIASKTLFVPRLI